MRNRFYHRYFDLHIWASYPRWGRILGDVVFALALVGALIIGLYACGIIR